MARFYVEHNGEWNIFSTIVDDFLFDEFVCIDALKARLLYERFKELTEDIDSLMTDKPKVNVMPYEEAVRIADRKTENSSEKPNNSTISKMEQVDEPQTEETEMERLERIDNELEDAWARIRELTDEPQTDCAWK